MRKLVLCIILSFLAILGVLFQLHAAIGFSDGEHYWKTILCGDGRELEEKDGRVIFMKWGRWSGLRGATRKEIDAARVTCVRRYVDTLFATPVTGQEELPGYQLRLFEILTGYDAARDKAWPHEWWKVHRTEVSPTAEQARAFLAERKRLIDAKQKRDKPDMRYYETIDGYETIKLDLTEVPGPAGWLGTEGDALAKQWRDEPFQKFVMRVIYFPAFIFFVAYATPFVLRRLNAAGPKKPVVYAVLCMLFSMGVMLPYGLGYNPYSLSLHSEGTTTLFYDLFLMLLATLACGILGFLWGLNEQLKRKGYKNIEGKPGFPPSRE